MSEENNKISFWEKFCIWCRFSLYFLGLVLICLGVKLYHSGLPTIFRAVELRDIQGKLDIVDDKFEDLGQAVVALQTVQDIEHGKVKVAKKDTNLIQK